MSTQITELESIKSQVDDVLVVDWIAVVDNNYRKALHDLIQFNIQVHDDPAVSEVAAQRREHLAKLESEILRLTRALQEILAESRPVGTDWGNSKIAKIATEALMPERKVI